LAVDLGNALGLPACLTFLLRTEANGVGIDATQTVEAFTAVPGWLPHAMLLAHLPELVISVEQIRDIRLGRRIVGGELPLTRAYDDQGKLVAVLKSVDRMYQPTLVF
jgi:tRNA U55 pseudouridine synthase TruB